MAFEWDEQKARANLAKHGVDFETAAKALQDPDRSERWQRVRGEDRWFVYCRHGLKVLAVVYTETEGGTRIISARRAEKDEQKAYYRRSR